MKTERFIKTRVLTIHKTGVLMKTEKHMEALREVLEEIETASKDPRGMSSHQRRLAFSISLGVATLVELYFHRLEIIKPGTLIKHEWFKKSEIKEILSRQIIKPIEFVNRISDILKISRRIEEKRNQLAYGSPVSEDHILLEEVNSFFEIKRIIEQEVGSLE